MSLRKPVLDRKHRPRWQDELRTQRLVVASFALAISVALGIFAATAWSSFYDANLKEVALVNDRPVTRTEMVQQVQMQTAELGATYQDLQNQQDGGARDAILSQQAQAVQSALSSVSSTAADQFLTSLALNAHAADWSIEPTADAIDAEVAARRTRPTRLELSIILVVPEKPSDGGSGAQPTQEAWDAAKAKVQDSLDQVNGGADFGTLAVQNSDDPSGTQRGLLGWISPNDPQYSAYYADAADAAAGDLIGPLQNAQGWYILKVVDRQESAPNDLLNGYLASAGISDATYRAYVRNYLLRQNARDYFTNTVLSRYEPARKISEIYIAADTGLPVPKDRIRHILVSPIPGQQDQSSATQEQWDAALAKAKEIRAELLQPNADWSEIAKQSDDTGSASNAGILGWYDPTTYDTQFVPGFADALKTLKVGELSEPVQSQFGYHLIEIMDTRVSALGEAARIAQDARDNPDGFAQLAMEKSEDATTAAKGGDVGWIAHYQVDAVLDQAIFGLTEIGQISDPVSSGTGIYIYKLEDTSEAHYLTEAKRSQLAGNGYPRWLLELKTEANTWVAPEFAPSTATG